MHYPTTSAVVVFTTLLFTASANPVQHSFRERRTVTESKQWIVDCGTNATLAFACIPIGATPHPSAATCSASGQIQVSSTSQECNACTCTQLKDTPIGGTFPFQGSSSSASSSSSISSTSTTSSSAAAYSTASSSKLSCYGYVGGSSEYAQTYCSSQSVGAYCNANNIVALHGTDHLGACSQTSVADLTSGCQCIVTAAGAGSAGSGSTGTGLGSTVSGSTNEGSSDSTPSNAYLLNCTGQPPPPYNSQTETLLTYCETVLGASCDGPNIGVVTDPLGKCQRPSTPGGAGCTCLAPGSASTGSGSGSSSGSGFSSSSASHPAVPEATFTPVCSGTAKNDTAPNAPDVQLDQYCFSKNNTFTLGCNGLNVQVNGTDPLNVCGLPNAPGTVVNGCLCEPEL